MGIDEAVGALLRQVAAEVVMPAFRRLARHEIAEKSPGEVVTRVDREAEARLHDALAALGTGARVIGEEAAAEDPTLLAHAGKGLVWLVDPLDGTANFAAGRHPFGLMVALVADGLPEAAWIYDPVRARLCHARRGQGAFIDGVRVQCRPAPSVATLATQFMSAPERSAVTEAAARQFTLEPIPRCAAASYPRLVEGRHAMALFQRILPWDHAAGVLFLEEAGGIATHWDGSPYRVGGAAPGLLVAADPAGWIAAHRVLAPVLATVAPFDRPKAHAA
jgi:fructose-1,6-bisphosphatase/inositol monophosphatase family enzyme